MKSIDDVLLRAENILIIAPHPDDETLGCGGIMIKYGKKTDVLLLTNGSKGISKGGPMDETAIIGIREKEFRDVMKKVRIRDNYLLRLPDSRLRFHLKEMKQFNLKKYDVVFVPNRYECHWDHCVVYAAIRNMMHRQHSKGQLFEYEVWTPLRNPNYFFDSSDYFIQKQELISMYTSQLKEYNYSNISEGLGKYRGALCQTRYAEVYRVENDGMLKKLFCQFTPAWQLMFRDILKSSKVIRCF